MTKRLLFLNGPNLNLLGSREPEHYGHETLADIETACRGRAAELSVTMDFRQSNTEGELIDWIHGARGQFDGLIVNAGAFTHTSVALYDALAAVGLPVVEVHLSNIYRREAFRHHSYVSRAAEGVICGFRGHGYVMALDALTRILEERG